MAVSREVSGDLEGALELAEESNTVYPKGLSGDYAQMVRQRIWKKEKVEDSLEAANRLEEEADGPEADEEVADEPEVVEEVESSEPTDEEVKVRPAEDEKDQDVKVRPAE